MTFWWIFFFCIWAFLITFSPHLRIHYIFWWIFSYGFSCLSVVSSFMVNKTLVLLCFPILLSLWWNSWGVAKIINLRPTLSKSYSLGIAVKPILLLRSPLLLKTSVLSGVRLMHYYVIFYSNSLKTQPRLHLGTIRSYYLL